MYFIRKIKPQFRFDFVTFYSILFQTSNSIFGHVVYGNGTVHLFLEIFDGVLNWRLWWDLSVDFGILFFIPKTANIYRISRQIDRLSHIPLNISSLTNSILYSSKYMIIFFTHRSFREIIQRWKVLIYRISIPRRWCRRFHHFLMNFLKHFIIIPNNWRVLCHQEWVVIIGHCRSWLVLHLMHSWGESHSRSVTAIANGVVHI